MDNLAHSLMAITSSAILTPTIFEQHKPRLVLSSILVANLPDIDYLLNILGETTYHFHHRGFTHSFIGLPFVILLGYLVMRLIWRQRLQPNFGVKTLLFWLGWQILVSHFFLDYLTSYGVMFVYPLSMARFAYPLMFIIDPMLWLLLGVTVYFLLAKKATRIVKKRWAAAGIVALLAWCGILNYFKLTAEVVTFPASTQAEAYPAPLAPIGWLVIDHEAQPIALSLVSYYPDGTPRAKPQRLPERLRVNQLCDAIGYSTTEGFEAYQQWAGDVFCEDSGPATCICHSARYGFSAAQGKFYFGSVEISQDSINFVSPAWDNRFNEFNSAFLQGSGD